MSNWMKIFFLGLLALGMSLPANAAEFGSVGEVNEIIQTESEALLKQYDPNDGMQTGAKFSRLYFDVFEASGMELDIGLIDQDLVVEIESDFGDLIALSMKGQPIESLQAAYTDLKTNLDTAVELHENRSVTWGSQFVQSLIILLREGVEALLVITALVLYLKRSGNGDRVATIWYGAGAAVLLSILLAWAMMELISLSGAYRENFEGVVMLIAALMMIYVSGWLYQKRNLDWKQELMSKVDDSLTAGSVLAMAMVSFLAVFREGVETIFFYQALMADAEHSLEPVVAGMMAASVMLVGVYWAMKRFSYHLPIKQFFMFTAVFLLVMSFVFIGKGVLELQMGGWLDKTVLPLDYSIPWLGVFSNQETLMAQLALAALVIGFFVWSKRKPVRA